MKTYTRENAKYKAQVLARQNNQTIHIICVNGEYDACEPGYPFYRGAAIVEIVEPQRKWSR